ncbi:hypothetical protein AAHB54_12345, partial [Bacillus cereus]
KNVVLRSVYQDLRCLTFREQTKLRVFAFIVKRCRVFVRRFIDNGAHLYICGDGSKMAPDVEDTLCQAYQEIHEVSEQEARNWLDRLQEEGRYGKDVWAGI